MRSQSEPVIEHPTLTPDETGELCMGLFTFSSLLSLKDPFSYDAPWCEVFPVCNIYSYYNTLVEIISLAACKTSLVLAFTVLYACRWTYARTANQLGYPGILTHLTMVTTQRIS